MNARLYDIALGRFLSPDPYVQNPYTTQNYNRYTYAMNNPLIYIDQDGEFWEWVVAGLILLGKAYYDGYKANNKEPNPLNWGWKNANYIFSVGNNTGPSGGIGGSVSVGWSDGYTTNVGYNQNSGVGMGYGINGSPKMYYPGYDYNRPEKGAANAISQARKEYDLVNSTVNWMKDHFYASAQGEISYGVQMAGSFDKGVGINISPVHDILIEGSISNKESSNFYFEGEGATRKMLDFGVSYFAGVNYSQSIDLSSPLYLYKTHTIEVGALGIVGATFNFNDDWSFRNGFFGLDLSGKIALVWGASGSLKLGFVY